MNLLKLNTQGTSSDVELFYYQQVGLEGESQAGFEQKSVGGQALYLAELPVWTQARAEQASVLPVLTADSSLKDLDLALQIGSDALCFFVADFRDGRSFSLIKHLRHLGFGGEIWVMGDFALDQANYFVKSGVDAFLIPKDQELILQKTLKDLASAYDGNLVAALPLFS